MSRLNDTRRKMKLGCVEIKKKKGGGSDLVFSNG